MGARVSLALIDLSDERAAVARRLGDGGVGVVAWLLLPSEEGYFFNLDNPAAAAARYDDFVSWTGKHGLSWDGVSLDIEPSIEDMRLLFEPGERGAALRNMLWRALDRRRLDQGTAAYAGLVARMRADGYRVESALFPFIIDDRRARSTLIHRVLGAPTVRVDREVFMLYTSFQGALGPATLSSYGADAEAIAVGSTGGGAQDLPSAALARTLSWEELARDLRLARRHTDDIWIYSLEGCVAQGMLDRLETFDWAIREPAPTLSVKIVDSVRALLRGILFASAHPYATAAVLGAAVALGTRRAGTKPSSHS
jgi:hypothetical protein